MWKTRLRKRLWTTPFLFLLVVGAMLLLTVTVVFELPKANASLKWPTVEGVVLTSKIQSVFTYPDLNDEGWCPSVSYRYSIHQYDYVSEKIEIQDFCLSDYDFIARKVVDQYPAGKAVTVYYNPQNPEFAILDPGIPNFGIGDIWPLVVITMGVLGVVSFISGMLGILGVVKVNR